ncbi:MAG TPA: glycosyltransferase [Fibrobacteria bacterium]|nr:glycosyltransferase [Fibrobacteria bacterium]HOX52317.1 glycosyltransferase [Fibrobacteria bacterium]
MGTTKIRRFRADFFGSIGVVAAMVIHVASRSGRIWRLRRKYKGRVGDPSSPRVLMVGDNMDGTHGISVSAERLVRQLREVGVQAWVLGVSHTGNPPGARDTEGWVRMLSPRCVQDMFGYEGKELSLPDMDELLDFLETNTVDLVEIETPAFLGVVSLLLARWIRVPIVQNYRTDLLAYTRLLLDNDVFISLLRWWICGFLRFGSADVIVPSQDFVEQVHKMGVARHKIRFLVRGVDLTRFSPTRRDPSIWSHWSDLQGPVISYLGRVSREKGLETLAEAFELVLARRPDAVLCVIGDGPWKDAFQERMAPNGRAIFTGELGGDLLPAALASSDVFAFPSTTDTFGNAVLEALACGVATVVTDQGGPKEIVEADRSGLVVPGEDAKALSEAILRLLDDPSLRARLAEGGQLRSQRFSPSVSRDEHLEFYRKVHRTALEASPKG